MQPNFALYLASDGLELLHKVSSGWESIGRVNPDVADLTRRMDALVEKARALSKGQLETKLVLPQDQIRFLSVAGADTAADDDVSTVRLGLEGMTPYAVRDLAIAWRRQGDKLQVAAIAVETLQEAEKFALRHGLVPVACVGTPLADQFDAEPFFGTSLVSAPGVVPAAPEDGVSYVNPAMASPLQETLPAAPAPRKTSQLPSLDSTTQASPNTAEVISAETRAPQTSTSDTEPLPSDADALISASIASLKPSGDAVIASKGSNSGANSDKSNQTDVSPAPAQNRKSPALVLSALVLLLVLIVASISVIKSDRISSLLGLGSAPDLALSDGQPDAEAPVVPKADRPSDQSVPEQTLGLESSENAQPGTDTTAADGVPAISLPAPLPDAEPATPAEAAARYAATGIWLRSPVQSVAPVATKLGSFAVDTVTPVDRLPPVGELPADGRPEVEAGFQTPPNPPAPEQHFDLDDRGFVRATEEGAMTPAGHMVYLGRPPAVPPEHILPSNATESTDQKDVATQVDTAEAQSGTPQEDTYDEARSATETAKASVEEAVASAISEVRPRARPEDLVSEDELEPEDDGGEPGTEGEEASPEFADAESVRPKARPVDFAATVAAAQARARSTPTQTAPESTMQPSLPTAASVAKQATEKRAIDMNDVSLLGVMGRPSDRSALVRLSNGQVVKVKVGDRLDGGRVAAIGDTELRYIKSNRNLVLSMPDG